MTASPLHLAIGVAVSTLQLLAATTAHASAVQTKESGKEIGDAKPPATSQPVTSAPAEWNRPRSTERRVERERMVDYQIHARNIKSPRVLDAMKHVPRHWFVPRSEQRFAYADHPLPIGHDQTISQPYIVALMTEALDIEPGDVVLEVGTGSGYQAAVLAELTPHVYSIEIVEPLCQLAAETFKMRGYDTIKTRCGDGYAGWPEAAPFDAIIVTCAARHVPPDLVRQLKAGGRLCMPVGGRATQRLLLMTRREDGLTDSRTLAPVRFVPMTGEAQKKK
jgi:protein-L-isoaspartate(D-aspartate) O-methyltransferase